MAAEFSEKVAFRPEAEFSRDIDGCGVRNWMANVRAARPLLGPPAARPEFVVTSLSGGVHMALPGALASRV